MGQNLRKESVISIDMNKTLALKILEQHKIAYKCHAYDPTLVNGQEIAKVLKENFQKVYKTLVTVDHLHHYLVFVIPVNENLDLKKLAKDLNKKSIDMLKQKDLEPLTGYVHGGCSPLGMKKKFLTYYDEAILHLDSVYVSAGRVGLQLNPKDLIKITDGKVIKII